MKTFLRCLMVLVFLAGCVSCAPFSSSSYVREQAGAEDEGIPQMVKPVPTATEPQKIVVLDSTQVPTQSQSPSPTEEYTPTPEAVPTPVSPSPTSENLVLKDGMTFLGSQLDFLAETFDWGYETYSCARTYVGVANVLSDDPATCFVRAYPPAGTRDVGSYLFAANYWRFDETAQIGKPFAYKLYLYQGPIFGDIDGSYYWAGLNGQKVLTLFDEGKFSEEFTQLLKGSGDESKIPPFPQKIFPLTVDEFSLLSQHQELFPAWLKARASR